MIIPLDRVARIEEIPHDNVEKAGPLDVVQYRGEILPLIDLRVAMSEAPDDTPNGAPLEVVVCSERGRNVGLVVGSILDIVQESIAVKQLGARRGVRGSAVIQGRVTDVLDVGDVIRAFHPTLLEAS